MKMTLSELLDRTDYMIDIEILVEVAVCGRIRPAVVAKGTAGEIFLNGEFDNARVEFISFACDTMQIIVASDDDD